MTTAIRSLARRVVEAKAKGEPWALDIERVYRNDGNGVLVPMREVKALVAQLCEEMVAGMLTESEREALSRFREDFGGSHYPAYVKTALATLDKLRGER